MKKAVLDIHTHTIASGHAFSTLQEMAKAAAEKGIQLLGVTEHGPAIPGACNPIYFQNLPSVPRQMYGVELLLGAELNILDYRGAIDLAPKYLDRMDVRIAGLHSFCFTPGTIDENTQAVIGAISNPYIDIISHPGDGTALLDFEALVLASKQYNTLLEINNHSMDAYRKRPCAKIHNLEILRLCKKYEVPVILGSDAHISFDIARYDHIRPLLQETDFPGDLIINDKIDAFKKRLNKSRQQQG